jgi:hypothetical protein
MKPYNSKFPRWFTSCNRIAFLLLLLSLNCLGIAANYCHAQHYSVIGTGDESEGSGLSPYGDNLWVAERQQTVITASELTAAGLFAGAHISSIGYKVINNSDTPILNNWTVKVYTTSVVNPLVNGWFAGIWVASSIPATITVLRGWNQTELSSAFEWNGTDNLVIETCFSNPSGITGATVEADINIPGGINRAVFNHVGPGQDPAIGPALCSDNYGYANMQYGRRPNMRLIWTGLPCSGTPAPGNTLANVNEICSGGSVELSLQNATPDSGVSYQWQYSADSLTWIDIPNAQADTLAATVISSTWYRSKVSCVLGGMAFSAGKRIYVPPPLTGGTYTINGGLPTGGSNFHSFSDFAFAARCAITGPIVVNVTPGTYNEQFRLRDIANTSATNTITINGNGATISYVSNTEGLKGTVTLDGTDHVSIHNLSISGLGATPSQYAWGVLFRNNADYNTVDGCTIKLDSISEGQTNYYIGIGAETLGSYLQYSNYSDHISLTNNTIVGGETGIQFYGGFGIDQLTGCTISGNVIRNFAHTGILAVNMQNSVIASNDIHRMQRAAVSYFYGIHVSNSGAGLKIMNNKIHDPATSDPSADFYVGGISVSANGFGGNGFVDVINNLLYNMQGSGDHSYLVNHANNTRFINNAISSEQTGISGTGVTYGFELQTSSNVLIKNNNIVIKRSVTGNKVGTYIPYGLYLPSPEVSSSYNNIYVNGNTNNYIGYAGNIGFKTTMAAWQSASQQDANSVSIDPIFAGSGTGNLLPTNSALNNKGIATDNILDFAGNFRNPSTPDVGALEFLTPTCAGIPAGGHIDINTDDIVCPATAVSFSTSGFTYGAGISFQLQSASNVAGLWTNEGASSIAPAASVSPTATKYYRFQVKCAGGGAGYSDTVLLYVSQPLPGGTYTINSSQPTNLNTGGTNFNSFTDFSLAVNCSITGPVVVNVSPGTYNERLRLLQIGGTSATNTITVNGNGATIKYVFATNKDPGVIFLNKTRFVTINNLRIDGYSTSSTAYSYGVLFKDNACRNTINGCSIILDSNGVSDHYIGIAAMLSPGYVYPAADSNNITNNVIVGGHSGLKLSAGSSSNLIRWNIASNEIRNFYYQGIFCYRLADSKVMNNNIHRKTRASGLSAFYGIYLKLSSSTLVSGNRIHDPFTQDLNANSNLYGIYIDSCGSGLLVANNLIYNVQGKGTHYYVYNQRSSDVSYICNSISSEQAGSGVTAPSYGFYLNESGTGWNGITIKNNMVSITRASTGNKVGIYWGAGTYVVTSDFNNIYVAGSTNSYFGFIGNSYNTLANWQSYPNQDSNSLVLNPNYTNAGQGDLVPANAALANKGTYTDVIFDINAVLRDGLHPDIGAYELPVSSCAGAPNAGIASVDDTLICKGHPVMFNLSGFSAGTGITVQWERSLAGQNIWSPIPGATGVNFSYYGTDADYNYRAAVTCGNAGGSISYSNVLYVNVDSPHVAIVTPSGPLTFCYAGSVTLTAEPGVSYSWNSGHTTQSVTSNTSSYDRVTVKSPGGCLNTSYWVTMSPRSVPSLIKTKVLGPNSVCSPSTVPITINMPYSSIAGLSYQWKLNGSPIPGATDTICYATATGNYTLTVFVGAGGTGCSSTSNPKGITVKPAPTAVFMASGPMSFCSGGSVTLTAQTSPGATYSWLKNGAGAGGGVSRTFSVGGDYTVVAKLNGCNDTAGSQPITVHPIPTASIATADPTTFCANDNALLTATPVTAGYTYKWKNGSAIVATTSVAEYPATTAGVYKVMITSDQGCVSPTSVSKVKLIVNPMPNASITAVGSTTIASNGSVKLKASPSSLVDWQWYKDGVSIPGATASSYIVTQGGDYTVAITKTGCTTMSAIKTVIQLPMKEVPGTIAVPELAGDEAELSAYPNPTTGMLTVSLRGLEEVNGTIYVIDMNGKLMGSKQMTEPSIFVDMSGYASGMYLIRFRGKNGSTGAVKVSRQ